jgi:hypothetical protein
MTDEPGRNDPCWCGSGKKFKKCHYLIAPQPPEGSIDNSSRQQLRVAEAELQNEMIDFYHSRLGGELAIDAWEEFFDQDDGPTPCVSMSATFAFPQLE